MPSSRFAAVGMAEQELVCLPGRALARDATRRIRFSVHGTLHSAPQCSRVMWVWWCCLVMCVAMVLFQFDVDLDV